MTFYQEMQDVASEVLGEFKQGTIRYVKITPGNGPADNPGPSVPTYHDVDGAARGVSFKYIGQSGVVASDLQVTMNVRPDVTPDITGFVEGDGRRYKIIQVMTVPPFGVPIVHKIIFRK